MAAAVRIGVARPEDATPLLEIYAPYVAHTAITFEYALPSPEEFRGRIERILARYPYLVARQGDRIVDYADAFILGRPMAGRLKPPFM